MKIGVWCASTFVWCPSTRPTILYHVISEILTSYLPRIKRIMFISRVADVNGRVERNAKNFRFLAFRQILRAHQNASRCWKLLKIVQQSLHELKIMSFGHLVSPLLQINRMIQSRFDIYYFCSYKSYKLESYFSQIIILNFTPSL